MATVLTVLVITSGYYLCYHWVLWQPTYLPIIELRYNNSHEVHMGQNRHDSKVSKSQD